MSFNYVDTMFGKVVGYTECEPVRLSEAELSEANDRAEKLRSLLAHAESMGFRFDEEYGGTPQQELARIEEQIKEHNHVGMIREEIREGGMSQTMAEMTDAMFTSTPIFQRGWGE